MKRLYKTQQRVQLACLFVLCQIPAGFAQDMEEDLDSFNKIVVSPRINLTLVKGDKEHLELETFGVDPDKVNIKTKGKTLRIYLDKARVQEKRVKVRSYRYGNNQQKVSIYDGVKVNATVTYKNLKHLQIRGEQDVLCKDLLRADKFVIKLYGESNVRLASLEAELLKVSLFGKNDLLINSGQTHEQIIKLYGENNIDMKDVDGKYAKTTSYGQSELFVNTSEIIKLTALGESKIYYMGGAILDANLILGENKIRRIRNK